MTRSPFICGLILGLLIAWSMACSPMLPKEGWHVSDEEVARIQRELGSDVPAEAIRNPKIDYQHEVTVPCMEMLRICYEGMPWYWKALGSVPLGCTKFWFHAWREGTKVTETAKTGIAYTCSLSPGFVRSHEREHLEGMLHK